MGRFMRFMRRLLRSTLVENMDLQFACYWAVSPSPPGAPSDHGDSSEDALRFGAAVRMASTPASRVIAVTASEFPPSVETIITASPFCRSDSLLLGRRLNMRCKSGGPLPPGPPPAPPLDARDARDSGVDPDVAVVLGRAPTAFDAAGPPAPD